MKRNLLFALLVFPVFLVAQKSPDVFIRAFVTADSVLLRWVPANPEVWRAGNAHGYRIERYTADAYFDLAGQDPSGKGTLLADAVLPLPKADTAWNKLVREDKMNAFVFQSIHGPVSNTSDPAKAKTEEQMKFGFVLKACDVSVGTAKAHGLYFADKTALRGEVYVYRISLAKDPAGRFTPGISTTSEKQTVLTAPGEVHADFRNKRATLSFDVASTREQYAGYIIERSEDSIHFVRVNERLHTFARSQDEPGKTELVYQDTFPQNRKTYWYRVRGWSYFGLPGPASPVVKGTGKDDWNAFPEIDTLYSPDNKRVELRWNFTTESRADLAGFTVLRAPKISGPYQVMAEKLDTSIHAFADVQPAFTNYYVVCAISIDGDSGFSYPHLLQLSDNDPPPVPGQVSGMIDTNGVVHLSWNAVAADDLKGYRVFRCNTLQEEFYEVGDSILSATTFTDTVTLQTLTCDVYYCVRSVDRVYSNSANSLPCRLKRPDKIPPVPPVVRSAFHTDTSICLLWINSSSDDLMCMELFRGATQLGSWTGKDTVAQFADHSAIPGAEYSYRLVVTDSSGNRSETVFPGVRFQPRVYPAVTDFSATPDLEKRVIRLSWKQPHAPVDRYIIYKAKAGEPLRAWKTLNGSATMITDGALYPGNTYVYKIKAVMRSGSETRLVGVEVVF